MSIRKEKERKMKRKKYLACCLVASMMLGVASPAMVGAAAQEDNVSVNENADVEVADDIETSDVEDSEEICTFRINGAPFPRQRCKRLAPAVRYPFVVTC